MTATYYDEQTSQELQLVYDAGGRFNGVLGAYCSKVLSDLGGNIHASSSITGRDRVAILRYEVELSDPSMVPRLIADLRGVDGVFAAFRIVGQGDD